MPPQTPPGNVWWYPCLETDDGVLLRWMALTPNPAHIALEAYAMASGMFVWHANTHAFPCTRLLGQLGIPHQHSACHPPPSRGQGRTGRRGSPAGQRAALWRGLGRAAPALP